MSSSRSSATNKSLGASWPTTSDIKRETSAIAVQQSMDKPTSSSAIICKQEEESNEEECVDEIEIGSSGEEDEATIEGNENEAPEFKIDTLIHSRELLEKVICQLENVQLLYILYSGNLKTVHNCFLAFRLQKNENEESNGLYIDQISNVEEGKIRFKHLGQFEFSAIQPHKGPIGDEDFEKWLDMLIRAGEELPKIRKPLKRKKQLIQRLHSDPQKLLNEMFAGEPPLPKLLAYIDISPLILQIGICNRLLRFPPTDFANIMTGLCIQVDITQINHSLKLPPLMNSLKYMLIPISSVTFDEPNPYQLPMKSCLSNVLVQTMNANGDVLCSSQLLLPQQDRVPSKQLVQISVTFWAMNNIPIPTSEQIQHKAAQLRDALKLSYKVHHPNRGKYSIILPIGPPPLLQNNQPTKNNNDAKMNLPRGSEGKWNLRETGNGRYLWEWITEEMKKTDSKNQRYKKQHKRNHKQKTIWKTGRHYSLGGIYVFMFTGQHPDLANRELHFLIQYDPLYELIKRMMHHNPRKRPTKFNEMIHILEIE